MKRNVLIIIMIILSVTALTGCKKKEKEQVEDYQQLSCTLNSTGESVKVNMIYEFGELKKATLTTTQKFTSEQEATEQFEAAKIDQAELIKYSGLDIHVSKSGESVTASYSFILIDLDDNAKTLFDKYFKDLKDKSHANVIKYLEGLNYTCKQNN